MSIQIGEPPGTPGKPRSLALFALGFRPFFLLAGLSAVILLSLWLPMWSGNLTSSGYFSAVQWHAHEMLYGYTVSVIAGFLLTAVRNWTGMSVPVNGKLALLAILWLIARMLIIVPGVPASLVAATDLLFIPLLAASLFHPLWNGPNRTNRYFLLLFTSMTIANLMFHLDALGYTQGMWQRGTFLMLDTILLTLLLVTGRVMPFFTEKAVAGSRPKRIPLLEQAGFVLLIMLAFAHLYDRQGALAGVISLILGVVQMVRLWGWYHSGIWRIPVLLVLYTGYVWMIIGLTLLGISSFLNMGYQLGVHGVTAGAVGIVTLGMMSRVALGHTGRDINTAAVTNVAFLLLNISALVRVAFPLFLPEQYAVWIHLSGTMWIAGFVLFILVYLPVLVKARVDGRPG